MKSKAGLFDVAIALVFVGGLLVMTRPGSQGAALVRAITGGFSGALAVATGQVATRRRG